MNLRMNRWRPGALVRGALLCCLIGGTSGCTILSVMDLAFAGQEDKQRTLGERVTKFHRELSWGTGTTYIEFIETSKRTEMSRQYRQAQQVEKLVDLEVRDTEFHDDDPDKADVDVKVRYYSKSTLQVTERFEKETWGYYRFRGGWFLLGREVSPIAPVG